MLRFEDVRNDTVSIANLWERFQMTKMNKEMKTEVKQLKSQIKSLKREVMDAKEGSSKEVLPGYGFRAIKYCKIL